MENRRLPFLFFVLLSSLLRAQVKPQPDNHKPFAGDCAAAVSITINTNSYYGPTFPPYGFGKVQEIKEHTPQLFEQEHNTAWYLLNITRNGEFVFEIVPEDSTNDYDFMLLKYTDSTFCDAFRAGKIKPLRSNLSNLSRSKKGLTGLRAAGKDSIIGKGPGNAYSNSIIVKKGERYMLVLDNVTPNGKGHTIFFNFVKMVEVKGKITDEKNVPLVADVTLSDNKGNTMEETKSDDKGEYSIKTALKENVDYSVSYLAEESFVQTTIINTKDLKGKTVFPDIKTVLPKLEEGEKYKLSNIVFFGNAAIVLPESYPSVDALYRLMKKNEKMVIAIQGHVNNWSSKNTQSVELFDQELSTQRAKNIYDLLVSKGIEKERMSYEGFSNKQMLFPHPKNQAEEKANRRVEIKVVSIK